MGMQGRGDGAVAAGGVRSGLAWGGGTGCGKAGGAEGRG